MAESTHRPKNWLLIKLREYHTWMGVILSLAIEVVCLTGLYLNHKDLFEAKYRPMKGEEDKKPPTTADATPVALTTTTDLSSLPVTLQQALTLAREHWGGDAPVERIELKNEHGQAIIKIKSHGRPEILIDAQSGQYVEKIHKNQVGKVLHDLHTGNIGGLTGTLIVDLTSVVIIVLTVTGVYLWVVPILRKRRSAKEREATARARQAELVQSS